MSQRPEDLAATLVHRARRRRENAEQRLGHARTAVTEELKACIADGTVTRAWLIGSGAWGGVHARSDLDVVVEGFPGSGFGALWDRLSTACGLDVDLLLLEDLDRDFRERVIAEGVEVHGP